MNKLKNWIHKYKTMVRPQIDNMWSAVSPATVHGAPQEKDFVDVSPQQQQSQ